MNSPHDPPDLLELQRTMAARVHIPSDGEPGAWRPSRGSLVCSMDIQYDGDDAHVAADLHRLGEPNPVGTWTALAPVLFDYTPGLFCFREGPPLLALIKAMAAAELPTPDVLVIDGHGIAHPRRFGVASWMGVETGIPSLGCAKGTLLRFQQRPDPVRGAWTPVTLDQQLVGAVLTTQDDVKPVYVSPGHLIGLDDARQMILDMGGPYRVPDPLRRADAACRARSRGETGDFTDLGALSGFASMGDGWVNRA